VKQLIIAIMLLNMLLPATILVNAGFPEPVIWLVFSSTVIAILYYKNIFVHLLINIGYLQHAIFMLICWMLSTNQILILLSMCLATYLWEIQRQYFLSGTATDYKPLTGNLKFWQIRSVIIVCITFALGVFAVNSAMSYGFLAGVVLFWILLKGFKQIRSGLS
jgi:hypothetical protein